MSSNNTDYTDKRDKTRDFRMNKKFDKSQVRFARKKKHSSIYPEEDFNCNELPSGAFDKVNHPKKEQIQHEDEIKNPLSNEKVDEVLQKNKTDIEEDEEEYEQVDESYFEQIPYVKK